ncbi:MAG: hypothetical protein NXI24_08320 [bacterium]|nr:hypothetical protein [bacterium]
MRHQFYHYLLTEVGAGALTDAQLSAIESTQDHARSCFAGDTRVFPPPLAEDPNVAALCLTEWHAVLDDLSILAAITAELEAEERRPGSARIAFRIKQGALALGGEHSWVAREAPVFRSGDPDSSGAAVLYSDIVALDEAYALLELRASDEELRLNISGGGKNEGKLYISLYTNGRLVEKSLLGTEVSWDLSDSEPGLYQLDCGDKPALSFQIQE